MIVQFAHLFSSITLYKHTRSQRSNTKYKKMRNTRQLHNDMSIVIILAHVTDRDMITLHLLKDL